MGRTKLSVVLIIVCAVKCLAMTYHELNDFSEYLRKTSLLSPTTNDGIDLDDDYDDDEAVPDHAWEESGMFEGDMILNERQRNLILEDVAEGLISRNGIRDGALKWPNNEVIFHIKVAHFTSDHLQIIRSGMDELTRRTCIKFRPYRNGDHAALVIQGNLNGCFSHVGYQGGYQVMNLCGRHRAGTGCFQRGIIMHELLHALGFLHIHSSPERDDYVDIVWDNIPQEKRYNFKKFDLTQVSNYGVGYDYASCLHYSRKAFSSNGQDTIIPKQADVIIGQREAISEKDVQKVNVMYCDASKADNLQADEHPRNNNNAFSQLLSSLYRMLG